MEMIVRTNVKVAGILLPRHRRSTGKIRDLRRESIFEEKKQKASSVLHGATAAELLDKRSAEAPRAFIISIKGVEFPFFFISGMVTPNFGCKPFGRMGT